MVCWGASLWHDTYVVLDDMAVMLAGQGWLGCISRGQVALKVFAINNCVPDVGIPFDLPPMSLTVAHCRLRTKSLPGQRFKQRGFSQRNLENQLTHDICMY